MYLDLANHLVCNRLKTLAYLPNSTVYSLVSHEYIALLYIVL